MSEWFPVRMRICQESVMSPWLFNTYMDGVAREVDASMLIRSLTFINSDDRVEDKSNYCLQIIRLK